MTLHRGVNVWTTVGIWDNQLSQFTHGPAAASQDEIVELLAGCKTLNKAHADWLTETYGDKANNQYNEMFPRYMLRAKHQLMMGG